jgi:hypothetical protein
MIFYEGSFFADGRAIFTQGGFKNSYKKKGGPPYNSNPPFIV